ncbi:hypothetical protein [Helicobacter sp. MIT 14-3879]|uniref:hypothetical protein n=1 Tax=Helicobacter sp. MIT 14-3879 TaxID=2040649 RepID=UPI002161812D|nr:hypothetical protein [Helicobacter sp. MIT 14-3879]
MGLIKRILFKIHIFFMQSIENKLDRLLMLKAKILSQNNINCYKNLMGGGRDR